MNERKTAEYCKAPPRRLVFIALAAMLPLFFVGAPDWSAGPLAKALWNLGHPLFFGLLVIAVAPRLTLSGPLLWLVTTAAVLLLGVTIELLQSLVDRTTDWRDLARNLIGAWLVLAWSHPPGPAPVRIGLRGGVLLLLLVELASIAQVGVRQLQVAQQLPALFDFSHQQLTPYWSGQGLSVSEYMAPGERHSLALELDPRPFSGVSLDNLPRDWRGYQALRMELYNPSPEPLPLTIRIHDLHHDQGPQAYNDRFNRRLTLTSGRNNLVIPLTDIEQAPSGRTMDMAHIRRLGLFASALPRPRRVYLLDLRLQ